MDPVTNKILQGTPFAGMGGTQERNALIGVIRNLISQDKYTVDYILNYAQSVGYQRQMAEEVFKELTGLSPKLIVNNNEYYNMPSYVPNMCIAWGMSKSNKEKAFYIVPFEYGFAVMEKDEVNAPIPTVISATIPEAFDELKKVAKGIQTLDKIITKKLLETEDVQTDAKTVHQVNLPYAASPLQVLKKNFKDKVINVSEFEKQASKLLASEEITVDEAEDLMAWKQDLIDEDETYGNDVLELDEQWNEVKATVKFEDIMNEVKMMAHDDSDFIGFEEEAKQKFEANKDLFENVDLIEGATRLYQLLLGFSKDEILGHSKVEKKMNKKSSDKDFEDAFENELVFDDSDNKAYFPGYEEYKFDIESDYQKMKQKALEVWKKINSSKKIKADMDLSDIPGVEFIWHNNTVDPEIKYNGHLFNYWSVEDDLYNSYRENEKDPNDESFNLYVKKNIKPLLDEYISLGNVGKKINSSKKVTAENMTLDDIEAEDNKDQVQEEIEKINETPVEDIFSETTPEEYFDDSLKEDKVDTINEVVSRCIDKFSEKFKDFDKYNVQILSYNTKVLGDYEPTEDELVEDKELNANAILQVILSITNKADNSNMKKVLAVFSITNGELHWTGTVRGENDQVVAFTEEGLDALFEVEEPSEDELEDII